ncbi:MAG: NADH-quinone oxidoreductase subunit J [Acidobacteria bacterium]|nr:NADH-quinone oxidoreductase subunit J [Acidobacteriota bacterium]
MVPIFFFLFAGAAIGFAVNLLIQRHPIYSALSLIGVMASLASLYLMLGAEFIAAVQVIVYAGAIMVLFVFVIMLLNAGEEERTQRSRLVRQLGAPLIVMFLGLVTAVIYRQIPEDAMVRFGDFRGQTASIGLHLFLDYLLPFEVVSILILVAIIGAVVLAQKET